MSASAVQHAARPRGRHRTLLEDDLTVDDHIEDAFGILMRLRVRRSVFDARWIEDGDIRRPA